MNVYIVWCGYDYEGGYNKAVVATMEEAVALKAKYQDSEHFSYDEVEIETWAVGDVTDRRWERDGSTGDKEKA